MFKYLRTINTEFHPTVVEFFVSPNLQNETDRIELGCMCNIGNNGYIQPYYDFSSTMFLTLDGRLEDAPEKKIKCIRIISNMVLEADIHPDSDKSKFYPGARLSFGPDIDGYALTVENNEGKKFFEVLDNSEVYTRGKVTVIVL